MALSSNLEREKRIAESVQDSIIIGEVISLKTADAEFIGLLSNEEPVTPRGSIIILHGMGSNPNAPHIVYPLRSQLAELGWITASIQLPIAAHGASVDDNLALIKESGPRIEATLDYMRENFKNSPCVVIAHSLGAIMATDYFAHQEKLVCDALVLIGLPTLPSTLAEAQSTELLQKISIPVLDIFGSQDLDSVKKTAPTRKFALIKNNSLNRQIEISGADHAFNGLDDTLVLSIHNWLTHVFKHPPSITLKRNTHDPSSN
jgi:pimeloyl-ACP methyl ester carboxylesterase